MQGAEAPQYLDVEQGSPEWHEARRGIPTASKFQTILAAGAGRQTYLYKLAGERMTGAPSEEFSNEDMERGKRMEPEIRADYEFRTGFDVTRVGFIRNGKAGASTDGTVGEIGIVEYKSMEPHLLIALLEGPLKFPNRFYAQCQGGLMISGRQWCDLMIYWPKMPRFLVRTQRDENYILGLRNAIDVFDLELRRLVNRLKEM